MPDRDAVTLACATPHTGAPARACPLCGARRTKSVDSQASHEAFRHCVGCGAGYWTSPWTAEHRLSHYDGYYDRAIQYDPLTERRYHALLSALEQGRAGRRLLDIGCGAGHLLSVAASRGWQATGLEVSRSACDALTRLKQERGLGFSIVTVPLAEAQLPGASFDAVTMVEVIEHVEDPVELLQEVARVLSDGGALYLTTPNYGSLSRRVLGTRWRVVAEEHRALFTPQALRQALRQAGLHPVRIATKNIDLIELMRKRSPQPAAGATPRPSARQDAQRMRHRIEGSARLRAAKALVNAGLNATRLGDTIEALAVKGRAQ